MAGNYQSLERPGMNIVRLLPIAALAIALITISTSCSLALGLDHVPTYPHVSECGIFLPEKYVFSLGLTSTSFLLSCLLVINHIRTEQLLFKTESQSGSAAFTGMQLGFGLSSTLSLALMATVSVGEMQVVHVLFAFAFFIFLVAFQGLNLGQRIYRARMSSSEQGGFAAAHLTHTWMGVWIIGTLGGFILWAVTSDAIPQYVAIASVFLHFIPYIWELRDTNLSLDVKLANEADEEANRSLTSEVGMLEKHSRVQWAPLAVAALVVCVVVVGMAVVVWQVLAANTIGAP